MYYSNIHAVVTGGANGIGRCIGEAFLGAGAAVTVIDTDQDTGVAFRHRFERLRFFHGDIAEKAVLETFSASLDRPVDCLIHNACLSRGGLLSGCSWADFEYVQRVGVTAPFYLTNLLLRRELLAPSASIVNIASTRAFQSQPDTESYSAAKGGIAALTHAMAVSLAGRARVNCISPGWIETADWHEGTEPPCHSESDNLQHPSGRVGRPEDIAAMVLFLCDNERAGFITGENINIDGGMSKLMVYHGDCGWKLEGRE